MAEEQEQVSKSPPGRTAFSARALIFWYFRLARGRSRTDGASLGGSHITTSYSSVLAFKNAETSLETKLQIPSSAFLAALRWASSTARRLESTPIQEEAPCFAADNAKPPE